MDRETNMELTDSVVTTPSPAEPAVTPEVTPAPEPVAEPVPEPVVGELIVDQTVPLYELPDGRQVDPETLAKEWKENFLPDYTRKSQKLAEIEKGSQTHINNPVTDNPTWKDPNYVPSSYAELIEIAEKSAIEKIQAQARAEEERVAALHQKTTSELATIKRVNPKLDENALFQHATKYGFKDLVPAYNNMVEMRKIEAATEQRVLKDIKAREIDPVSSAATGIPADDDGYDPAVSSRYSSAVEYLQRIKK